MSIPKKLLSTNTRAYVYSTFLIRNLNCPTNSCLPDVTRQNLHNIGVTIAKATFVKFCAPKWNIAFRFAEFHSVSIRYRAFQTCSDL